MENSGLIKSMAFSLFFDEEAFDLIGMIMNILKSIFEMLLAYIPIPLK